MELDGIRVKKEKKKKKKKVKMNVNFFHASHRNRNARIVLPDFLPYFIFRGRNIKDSKEACGPFTDAI